MSVQLPPKSTITGTATLQGTQSSSGTTSSNPLSGHSATVGNRGTSILSRIKAFFSSLLTTVGKPFLAMAKALSGFKTKIGDAIEARRQNALKSPGPPKYTPTGDAPRTRQRSDSSPLPRSQPPLTDPPGPRPHTPPLTGTGPQTPPDGSVPDDGSPPDVEDDPDSSPPPTLQRPRSDARGDLVRPRPDNGRVEDRQVGSIAMHEVPSPIVRATRTVALRDPDLAALSTGGGDPQGDANKLVSVMGRHFNATASPSFWATPQAKSNAATFGGALAFSVIDRIKSQGQMTEQDRTDFRQALSLLPGGPDLADIPDDLMGRLGDDKLDQLMDLLADMVLSVYGGPDTPHPLPGAEDPKAMLKEALDGTEATGSQKVDILRDIFIDAVSKQPPTAAALRAGLEAMT